MRTPLIALTLAALAAGCSKSSAPASPSNGGGGAKDPAAQRAAFDALVKFLGDGAADPVRDLFVDEVSFEEVCSLCDPEDPESNAGPQKVKGSELVETLGQRVRTAAAEDGIGGFVVGETVSCADDCCTVSYEEGISHSYVFLDKVCFTPGTTRITSLEFTNGG